MLALEARLTIGRFIVRNFVFMSYSRLVFAPYAEHSRLTTPQELQLGSLRFFGRLHDAIDNTTISEVSTAIIAISKNSELSRGRLNTEVARKRIAEIFFFFLEVPVLAQ
jgi:hypothetical protein